MDTRQFRNDSLIDSFFAFRGLLPGAYELSLESKYLCWNQTVQHVTTEPEETTEVEFVQSGFELIAESTHDLEFLCRHKESSRLLSIAKGHSSFCLPREGQSMHLQSQPLIFIGKYALIPQGCYGFDKDELIYDTAAPTIISLSPSTVLVTGLVTKPSSLDIHQTAIEVRWVKH